MAAERTQRHEERMEKLRIEQDSAITELTNKNLNKEKKAMLLVKEGNQDMKEKM